MGRRTLVKKTGYTESAIRTQLEKLRERGWVRMSKQGTVLTKKGRKRYKKILKKVREIKQLELVQLAVDEFNLAALIKETGNLKTWSLRDLAVAEKASGAVFISCVDEELKFTDSNQNIAKKNPYDAKTIKEAFPVRKNGELILIVFGPSRKKVSKGLWRITTELMNLS